MALESKRFAAIRAASRVDEADLVRSYLSVLDLTSDKTQRIQTRATQMVTQARAAGSRHPLDAFMAEYDLASEEGIVLMCLAEALLRIPDAHTADRLIKDKIGGADWDDHFGKSESFLVNASTWALMLTGRVMEPVQDGIVWQDVVGRLIGRISEPVVRTALAQAMKLLGNQFVLRQTIGQALDASKDALAGGYRFSYDMLGEAALTQTQSDRYFKAYLEAINIVGSAAKGDDIRQAPSISVKLSSLHPRYEVAQTERVLGELLPCLMELVTACRKTGLSLCVDAEEADRLDLSLQLIERVAASGVLRGWDGFGLAVQAYQKRAGAVVDWLIELARKNDIRFMVRLVKGAYWDTEIKRAQERGLDGFPVFTRKASTDLSYLVCAQKLLAVPAQIYPCFATHNARTVSALLEMAQDSEKFEFQALFGMGREIYDQVISPDSGLSCRIYAPVGSHEALLPYLMRRLLENGANTSFLNRLADRDLDVSDVVKDPVEQLATFRSIPHPDIPMPRHLFGAARPNSIGRDLQDYPVLEQLRKAFDAKADAHFMSAPRVDGQSLAGAARAVQNPADRSHEVGLTIDTDPADALRALKVGHDAQPGWARTEAGLRAAVLHQAADLFESQFELLAYLLICEAGKTWADAQSEVREAVDFLRYYAADGERLFETQILPGPAGETNRYGFWGRGVFLCIAPWNFPLAIFTGQVAAALMAGNSVLAKPAEQTSLIAAEAIALLHQAGIPEEVLGFIPGDGPSLGQALLSAPELGGVCFTGSTEVAKLLHRQLASRPGPILPLIAETGGQNAMIVDSSALPEQAVTDILSSAFQSAGQRCSALRVLFVQKDVYSDVVSLLKGAMAELKIGNPLSLSTDVGPVIDQQALKALERHHSQMEKTQKVLSRCSLEDVPSKGFYFPPTAYEIESIDVLQAEVFGPCLHVAAFDGDRLGDVVSAINGTGYGLTLSIHSRIGTTIDFICRHANVGNIYVNRNQIGAVVGSQPFGGLGLSGTGPKAGGPNYLHAFAGEYTVSTNIAAVGGNTDLMALRS